MGFIELDFCIWSLRILAWNSGFGFFVVLSSSIVSLLGLNSFVFNARCILQRKKRLFRRRTLLRTILASARIQTSFFWNTCLAFVICKLSLLLCAFFWCSWRWSVIGLRVSTKVDFRLSTSSVIILKSQLNLWIFSWLRTSLSETKGHRFFERLIT